MDFLVNGIEHCSDEEAITHLREEFDLDFGQARRLIINWVSIDPILRSKLSKKEVVMFIKKIGEIKMNETIREILNLIKKDKQFIFSSFNDKRISQVEESLGEEKIDYITTSQTGNDFIIGIEGSSFYRKFHGKK